VWAGLGYYARAKRLHEAAKKVAAEYNGILPREAARLEKEIPGIGPYTAGRWNNNVVVYCRFC
jgi:A/G-specific adenine glycosylase